MQSPLSGTRVVDLTRILSGPFCTMLLGDMGADVVKVEDPGEGDPIRRQGAIVDGLSWYFAAFNRNKRSLVLNLRTDEGRRSLDALLERADVLVENFRPGVLAKMGYNEGRLHAINPRLIVASINGFGSTGPYADRPAFDFVVQAMSGFMSVNGMPDGPPLRSGVPITDLVAGLYAAFGVVNALRARDRTGRGQRVEAAMTDGIISMLAYLASDYLATGELPVRTGNDHPIASPYGLFTASDGEIAVAPSTEVILERFLAAIGHQELLADPRFETNLVRRANRPALNALINERLRTDTQANWVQRLNQAGVPCGIVQNVAEALNDPQSRHQEMVIEVDHPGHGPVRMLGFPVKLSGTPCEMRYSAPEHGAHTQEILLEWGIEAAEMGSKGPEA
jgi:CoA:oxalate CoA-transferase